MKLNKLGICGLAIGLSALGAANAKDITIYDNHSGNNYGTDVRPGVKEDNETEPGTVTGQEWDLEAFYLDGTKLSMVGGFNFLLGEGTYASGDIFIDVNGDAKYGSATADQTTGTQIVPNSKFGYDYVISFGGRGLNSSNDSTDQTLDGTYKVYSLTGASDVTALSIGQSNPWTYSSGGSELSSGTVSQTDLGTSDYNGLTGGRHYKFGEIDLSSFLTADQIKGALFHFTMECGNDNLIGRVPDTGATVLLLGAGLTALGLVRRRVSR